MQRKEELELRSRILQSKYKERKTKSQNLKLIKSSSLPVSIGFPVTRLASLPVYQLILIIQFTYSLIDPLNLVY